MKYVYYPEPRKIAEGVYAYGGVYSLVTGERIRSALYYGNNLEDIPSYGDFVNMMSS